MSRRREWKVRKASLEQENEQLKRRVATLEEQVQRLITQPPIPQIMPIPVVVPCPCPAPQPTPTPWRVVPFQPYQPYNPPVWPQQWPEIICQENTISICSVN